MIPSLSLLILTLSPLLVGASMDYFRSQDLDSASHLWVSTMMENSSLGSIGCTYCGDFIEPPPDDIMFIPPPPLHSAFNNSSFELTGNSELKQSTEYCNFCSIFSDGSHLPNESGLHQSMNNRIVAILVAFLSISAVLFVYVISTKRSKIIASLTRKRFFHTDQQTNNGHLRGKSNTLNETITNSGVLLSDPCYLQTNRDKNLTSPIISDHVSHKKTAIPSKYWAQPGSIIGRTVRRIPNEYEVPSSRTNSTGTSSAVYADINNESNQRFISPYNLHTYAEVREILDTNEHFHTSSNSSAMLSEANYDNAVYPHGSCALSNGGVMTGAPNGSVQMSDFNSMRAMNSMTYGQPSLNHHLNNVQTKINHGGQPMYEQLPQRAQVIITSSNQGVNPTLLNHQDRIHNVI